MISPNVEAARWSFGDVHVWLERIDARPGLDEVGAWLDDDEQARARRFRFERDRARFVTRRAFLRRILAGYLGMPPATIRYRVTPLGRPELDPSLGVTFSTSHADGLAMVAVARDRRVGVDLEWIREIPHLLDLVDLVCSRSERRHLLSLPRRARDVAFLRLWTRKESYAKAIGAGLSVPFDEIDFGRHDHASERRMALDEAFVFRGLDRLTGYVGTVAASGAATCIRRLATIAAPV